MFWLSIKARNRIWEFALAAIVIYIIWLLQLNIMTRIALRGLFCNLPLTFTIIWSSIFGSSLRQLSADELRLHSVGSIIFSQAIAGSSSGALVGSIFAALYASVTPVYLISYPLIGWIAGYFPLRNVNHGSFFGIILVFAATILAEFFTACQLIMLHRADVFARFTEITIPEAVLNALIAPFIFVPVKIWYDFRLAREVTVKA